LESQNDTEKVIVGQITLPAPLVDVWDAWTTEEGAQSFFAPKCKIRLEPGGAYEMLFDLDADVGNQGGEGMIVLAVQPRRMLAFTWNAPPHLPTVRGQMTHVTVRMRQMEAEETLVTLRHDGWGEGGEWEEAYRYFKRAWLEVVLPRLKYRFEIGPIDWSEPPSFS
jgi:uncharacterized protein YndB with AHSA1/START domain